MKLLDWDEQHAVNVDIMDQQHMRLLKITNALYDTLGTRRTNEAKALTREFLEALREHFDTEEKLMKEYSYVEFYSHKLEHDRYYKKVDDFYNKLVNNETIVNLELLNSFRTWFGNHMELNDRKCAEFLNERGIK